MTISDDTCLIRSVGNGEAHKLRFDENKEYWSHLIEVCVPLQNPQATLPSLHSQLRLRFQRSYSLPILSQFFPQIISAFSFARRLSVSVRFSMQYLLLPPIVSQSEP